MFKKVSQFLVWLIKMTKQQNKTKKQNKQNKTKKTVLCTLYKKWRIHLYLSLKEQVTTVVADILNYIYKKNRN